MASVCHARVVRVYPQILNISNHKVTNENDNFTMADVVNIYDSFSRISLLFIPWPRRCKDDKDLILSDVKNEWSAFMYKLYVQNVEYTS